MIRVLGLAVVAAAMCASAGAESGNGESAERLDATKATIGAMVAYDQIIADACGFDLTPEGLEGLAESDTMFLELVAATVDQDGSEIARIGAEFDPGYCRWIEIADHIHYMDAGASP
jgi:hypothetical protein